MSNYADNILDKDGNPIYLEDKHLNDQTSQTTVATTDAVMLKDTNGAYHSIDKASFNEAVRAAMGSILTNFDKGASIARIPGIDSNNDLGSVTAANLASVLGEENGLRNCNKVVISQPVKRLIAIQELWQNSLYLIRYEDTSNKDMCNCKIVQINNRGNGNVGTKVVAGIGNIPLYYRHNSSQHMSLYMDATVFTYPRIDVVLLSYTNGGTLLKNDDASDIDFSTLTQVTI